MESSVRTVSGKCRRAYGRALGHAEHVLDLAVRSDERYLSCKADVSGWSIGQHLDHIANANREIAGAIQKILAGEAGPSRSGPTMVGRAVLSTGWIPRGAGKAPAYTTPKAASSEQVRDNLSGAREAVRQLGDALAKIDRSGDRADHFAFGGLTPMQWLRVIDVHTRHHLKIVADIERSAS